MTRISKVLSIILFLGSVVGFTVSCQTETAVKGSGLRLTVD